MQSNLFEGRPWFDNLKNEKGKMEKVLGIQKVLSLIGANKNGESIATEIKWYDLVSD